MFIPALLLGLAVLTGAWAEDAASPEDGHTDAHAVLDLARGEPQCVETDSLEGHLVRQVYDLYCQDCQRVIAESYKTVDTEQAHEWTEERTAPSCGVPGWVRRTCLLCGKTVEETLPALEHQWVAVSYTEPTCTENGVAVRQCALCHQEERLETPALGHVYTWVEVSAPSAEGDGVSENRCLICGDVAERRTIPYREILYNNTITSFGPAMRDLIGGSVWNRVTPVDLTADGVYTYPLVASNRYTVGTVTVIIGGGTLMVSYHLSSQEVWIHSESLVIYPDLNALRTGDNAVSFPFDTLISAAGFGEDPTIILSIVLKADYNILADGVQYFIPDEAQIAAMTEQID